MKAEFIDLGLPSGTLWASCNVGANLPEDYGDYKTFNEAKALDAPTCGQLKELYNECIWKWCKLKGVKGYKVIGKNGSSIFLPAAGYRSGGSCGCAGLYSHYWSSSLNTGTPYSAYYLRFSSDELTSSIGNSRCYGFSVRPVRASK